MKVAFFVTQLPAPSHTFIHNEIISLVKSGLDTSVISLNAGSSEEGLLAKPYIIKKDLYRLDKIFAEIFYIFKNLKNLRYIFNVHFQLGRTLKFFSYLYGGLLLAHHLRRDNINHLHVHFTNAALNIAVIASCLARIPITLTVHGPSDFNSPDFFFANKLTGFISGTRFISDDGMKRFSSNSNLKNQTLIHCGVDLTRFLFSSSLNNSKLKIVSVMRLVPQKNPMLLVEVAKILAKQHLDFEWSVVGSGELYSDLSQAIKKEGLESRVILFGQLGSESVKQKILESSLSVLVSNNEGIPVFLMESMALGRLVVATNVGGVGELVKDASTGFLVASISASSIASAIKSAWRIIERGGEDHQTIIENALRLVRAEFDLKSNTNKFKNWILGI